MAATLSPSRDFTPTPSSPSRCKKYRRHNCHTNHRLYSRMARCIWRRAHWITGEGPFASVSYCPSGPYRRAITVELHETLEEAQLAKLGIDQAGCGGRCSKSNHDIVQLVLPTPPS